MKLFEENGIVSEEMQMIIKNTNDLMFVKNKDFVYIASSLNGIFYASYFIDLTDYSFQILKGKKYAKEAFKDCKDIRDVYECFIRDLVIPEDQEKMREFCEVDTIAKRLGDRTHIDCEYRGTFVNGWCQTSFLPVSYDEEGNVTQVLFVLSSIDQYKAKTLDEGINNRKDLEAIFDEVPGGIVLYEWTGKELVTLKMSKYYEDLYGYSMLHNNGKPDFDRIHPDDLADYQKAYLHAINVTHELDYVYRVWNRKKNRYVWTQIDAISKPQLDGTSLVYAMYSDVTEQKEAELGIAKKQASLEAALSVSNQLCCEYDPELQSIDCLTKENFFHLQTPMNHYPDCLRDIDFVHPEDIDLFINTVHSTDDGKTSAHCDVRAKCEGQYRWYSCRLQPYFDEEKNRNIIILTIIDATLRMASIQDYKDRIQLLMASYEDSLVFSQMNMTKNTFEVIKADPTIKQQIDSYETIDDILLDASKAVVGEKAQKKYKELFNRKNLIELFEKGHTSVKMEHLMFLSHTHREWVESGFDMMRHPITGEITGVCYAKSINNYYISNMMLEKALECDYIIAAAVYADSGEYYMFNSEEDEHCALHQNYWEDMRLYFMAFAEGYELEKARKSLTKEKVLARLDEGKEFSYTFNGFNYGVSCRMEAKAVYLNKEQHIIMATIRNITDEALLRKYKHDSEHDSLTGLLNRNTLFHKCRELLDEHPDEQFVIMHGDMKHFHLYNTFFGDEAGDHILCAIADCLREMDKDYDYWAFGRIEADVFCTFFPLRQAVLEKHVQAFLEEVVNYRSDFLIEPAVGVYVIKNRSMSIESMFTRATIAAKSDKKNLLDLISVYDDDMEQTLADSQQVISEMQNAIDNEEFKVYLQPKYSLRTEKMVGAEALVRWINPEKGMISPGKFIPVFEGNGFITKLDHYMWEHVCQILRRWKDEGKPLYPISVNVSRISMYIQSTVPYLMDLVTRYEIDPKYLELELTESAYMDDPEDLKRMLKELQEFGFTILMDDFGSGYSSLNTLRELPVNILKLDMKFLSESQSDNRGTAVLSSVVRMSKLLNLPIVAEGVEKQEQADYLRGIGCEYVQGFLFARPMPVADYEKLLIAKSEMVEKHNVISTERIMHMLSNKDLFTDDISEAFPAPLALVEYDGKRMSVLRTNSRFLAQFGLIDDQRPASMIFKEKLSKHSHQVLMEAFKKCVQQKEAVVFNITWPGACGDENLFGSVDYEGAIDQIDHLLVSFINVNGAIR